MNDDEEKKKEEGSQTSSVSTESSTVSTQLPTTVQQPAATTGTAAGGTTLSDTSTASTDEPTATAVTVQQPVTTEQNTTVQESPDYSLDWDAFHAANPEVPYSAFLPQSAQYRQNNGKPGYSYYEVWQQAQKQADEAQKKDDKKYKRRQFVTDIGDFLSNLVNYARTRAGHTAFNIDLNDQRNRLDTLRTQGMQERRQRMQDMLAAWRQSQAEARQSEVDRANREYQDRVFQANREDTAWEHDYKDRVYNDEKGRKDRAEARQNERDKHTDEVDEKKLKLGWYNATHKRDSSNNSGSGGSGGVHESFTDHNGNVYVRKTPLSAQEARSIIHQHGTAAQQSAASMHGADVVNIAAQVLAKNNISKDEMLARGFQLSSKSQPRSLGWGTNQQGTTEDW